MPLYVYAVINEDGSDGETFEVLQGMSEEPLTTHPDTGVPVRRLLSAPNTARALDSGRGSLSDAQLDRLGFTKYKKAGKGTYEKTAGKGPNSIVSS